MPSFPDCLAVLLSHYGVGSVTTSLCRPRRPAKAVCVWCKSTCNPVQYSTHPIKYPLALSSVSWTSQHIGRQLWRAATVRASSASSNPQVRKWCALCHKASRRTSRISRHLWSICNVFRCWRRWLLHESGTTQLRSAHFTMGSESRLVMHWQHSQLSHVFTDVRARRALRMA